MTARLVVDGYNVIHAWPQLAPLVRAGRVEDARRALLDALAGYAAASGEAVTVVFDAHARERGRDDTDVVDGVRVLWGSKGNSADHVIERLVSEASRDGRAIDICVATNDRLQRDLVMAMGGAVMSADALRARVQDVDAGVGAQRTTRHRSAHAARRLENSLDAATRDKLERLRRGLPPT